jgi:hypothetical protein
MTVRRRMQYTPPAFMQQSSESLQVTRLSGCHAIIVAGVGALAAILTALIGSEPLKIALGSVSWPRREAALKEEVRQLVAQRDVLQAEFDKAAAELRSLRVTKAELQRQVQQLADTRQIPPPRLSGGYIKYDARKTDCLLAGAAALRLATQSEPRSISPSALFTEMGSHKAVVMCYPDDGLAFIACLGPSMEQTSTIADKLWDEFKGVAGIK